MQQQFQKGIMKKYLLFMLLLLCLCGTVSGQSTDAKTAEAMEQFDWVMDAIGKLPGKIDEDLCSGDKASYRAHMTELAQLIVEANTLIKDVGLYYPIDLWTVYNRISRDPVCGSGAKAAESAFGTADVSRISNEEKMGLRPNEDLCMCWNIATGRDEPTGYMKDGACRCTYGVPAYSPNIGQN